MKPNNDSGFTLIEVLLTVALLTVVAAIAMPNINRQIANKRLIDTTSLIDETIKLAVAESLISRKEIIFVLDTVNNKISLRDKVGTELKTYSYNKNSIVSIEGASPSSFRIGPDRHIYFEKKQSKKRPLGVRVQTRSVGSNSQTNGTRSFPEGVNTIKSGIFVINESGLEDSQQVTILICDKNKSITTGKKITINAIARVITSDGECS